MGLGAFELVGLKKAREKRSAAYALVKDGIDPIDERAASWPRRPPKRRRR